MSTVQAAVEQALSEPLKLDIGCGKNKKAGFLGVDQYELEGVDIVADLRLTTWYMTKLPEALRARCIQVDEDETMHLVVNSWRLPDDSVDEVHCSHLLEHLTNFGDRWERVNFFNELYRVMKVGATCQLIFPHWCSTRYYGDPTHKEPFSEMGFYYLQREWRLQANNAPHADSSVNPHGYACDFGWTLGYGMNPALATRNQDFQMFAIQNYKEAATDILATLTKK